MSKIQTGFLKSHAYFFNFRRNTSKPLHCFNQLEVSLFLAFILGGWGERPSRKAFCPKMNFSRNFFPSCFLSHAQPPSCAASGTLWACKDLYMAREACPEDAGLFYKNGQTVGGSLFLPWNSSTPNQSVNCYRQTFCSVSFVTSNQFEGQLFDCALAVEAFAAMSHYETKTCLWGKV